MQIKGGFIYQISKLLKVLIICDGKTINSLAGMLIGALFLHKF